VLNFVRRQVVDRRTNGTCFFHVDATACVLVAIVFFVRIDGPKRVLVVMARYTLIASFDLFA
jgi:hypothetical protein